MRINNIIIIKWRRLHGWGTELRVDKRKSEREEKKENQIFIFGSVNFLLFKHKLATMLIRVISYASHMRRGFMGKNYILVKCRDRNFSLRKIRKILL